MSPGSASTSSANVPPTPGPATVDKEMVCSPGDAGSERAPRGTPVYRASGNRADWSPGGADAGRPQSSSSLSTASARVGSNAIVTDVASDADAISRRFQP